MRLIRNIKLDNYNFFNDQRTRKIFSRGYEDLTTLIFYHDAQNRYKLVVAKEDDSPLIIEKDITRAQAFRLINTRP